MDEAERDEIDKRDRADRIDFRGNVLSELRNLNRRADENARKIDRLIDAFDGDGDEPGMKVKMDRLERNDSRRNRMEWVVMAAVILWIVGQMIKVLTTHM